MTRYAGVHVHTVTDDDVNQRWLDIQGRRREYPGGVIQPCDVGKMVMEHGGGMLSVENDGQLAAREAERIAAHPGPCGRFRLDYYGEGHSGDPSWRYCTCGWTEAHHAAAVR